MPAAHGACDAAVAHAEPAAHAVVSLVEPAGQKLPGVVHARHEELDVKRAPPVEYVPTAQRGSEPAMDVPGQ